MGDLSLWVIPSLHTFPCHPVKIFTFVPKLWRFDCICSSSGIAARCCYCSRSKSSLWLIWFSVSWSKMLFVAVLVCGGTQGSSSHVPGVTNSQILVQGPSAAPSARVAAAPSPWASCCHFQLQSGLHAQAATASSSCQTLFQLSSADVLRARAPKFIPQPFP